MSATYRDIKAHLLGKITQGDWPPGSLLPNEVEIAQQFGCARATVNRAMRELADDGLIERRRKTGSRVRMAPVREARFSIPIVRHEIENQGSEYRYSLVSSAVTTAPDWLRARLQLQNDAQVLHLVCMHYANGLPFQHEDRWINLAVTPDAQQATFTEIGPNEWLIAAVPYSTAEISFQAAQADPALAAYLDCQQGDALFQVERSTWWEGRAVTFVRMTHHRGYRMTTRY